MASSLAKSNFALQNSFAVQHSAGSKRSKHTQSSLPLRSTSRRRSQTSSLQSYHGLRAACALSSRSARPVNTLFRESVAAATRPGGDPGRRGRRGQIVCGDGMKLVFVSAEVAPWSKTGGLGDVLGGLPPALAARGHRVMTVSPRYDQYKDAWDTDVTVDLKVGDKTETVRYFHCYKRGVDRVFVDHPLFLAKVWGKTGGKIYGNKTGEDFVDNQLRFSLFAQAAIEAPRVLNLTNSPHYDRPYGEDVVFIANDWHTALLPCYLKSQYKPNGHFTNAKVAFCVHNIAYQGRFAPSDFDKLNLPEEFRDSFDFFDGYVKPVPGKKVNWMKAAFLEADKVLTVSPNYASELVSGPAKGVELDDVAKKVGVKGIVNGMDVAEWDPASDKYLDHTYDLDTVLETKPLLKEALQAEVGLPIDPSTPLIGFIGRLEEQKGSDILAGAVGDIVDAGAQLVVLGTGKKYLEKQLDELDVKYPEQARGIVKFNVPLAHLIIAGADYLVVPSRFEPCGLIQLQAMRYGTIPIVSSTGGLVDTVTEGVTGFHMGELDVDCETTKPEDIKKVVDGVAKAVKVYGTPKFDEMVKACMQLNLSWENPAKEWEAELLSLGVAYSTAGKEGVELYPKTKENVATP